MKSGLVAIILGLFVSGCFTISHCEYPQTSMINAGEKPLALMVTGFDATVVDYLPVHSYQTIWQLGISAPYTYGRHHHHRHHPYMSAYPSTVMNTTYVPQVSETSYYRERAITALEDSGFIVNTNGVYLIEVHFNGPLITDGDRTRTAIWNIATLLTADHAAATYTADLRIYRSDNHKLVYHQQFSYRYFATVWGPIPLFSPAGSDQCETSTMQLWSLSALTDQVIAATTEFLTKN